MIYLFLHKNIPWGISFAVPKYIIEPTKGLTTKSYKQNSASVLMYYLFNFSLYLDNVLHIMAY